MLSINWRDHDCFPIFSLQCYYSCFTDYPEKKTSVAMETGNNTTFEDDEDLQIQAGIVRSGRERIIAPAAMEPLISVEDQETVPGK